MVEATRVETAREAFAEVTGAIEDAAVIAAGGQASRKLSAARQSCDRLIALLEACLARVKRLRGPLE